MVVTRRVPAPPVPPTSRTTSTQNAPRAPRNISQQSGRGYESALSVRQRPQLPVPQNGGKRGRSKRGRRSRPLIPSFPLVVFTLFSLYALSTLHHSPAQSLRDALSVPHDNLIKPYIMSPLRAALTHPVIEPHVTNIQTNLQPYVQRVERRARPILETLSHLEENKLRPLVRRGTIATSRAAQKTWHGILVPGYNSFLRPHVQPYLDRWNSFYHDNVKPRLRVFVVELGIRYYKIKPRVDNARRIVRRYSSAAYSRVAPRVQQSYLAVKPRVIVFWAKAQPHLLEACKFFKIEATKGFYALKLYASVATTKLGDARREFVDPHVKRIWEKVEPRSSASSNITSIVSSSLSGATSSVSSTSSVVAATATSSGISTASSSVTSPLDPADSPSTVPISSSLTSHLEPINTQGADDVLESAASVISESIGLGVAAKEIENDVTLPTLQTNSAESVATTEPETKTLNQRKTVQSETPVVPSAAGDELIDDFLQELGISSDEQSDAQQPASPASNETPTQHVFSAKQEEESAAAFREKVAAKRAAIVKRHVDWQAQMNDVCQTRERDLRKILVSIRKKAVEELKNLALHSEQEGKREKIVDSIEQEASRLARGIEGYIKKEHDRKEKLGHEWFDQLDDKQSQWEKVMNKVDAKFADKVRAVQEEVHSWYMGIREKEGDEVLIASAELKSLAETAQANIGMDYAWLEDVTYEDWQKYHDLMRTAERFEETARAIQNGTHPHPPVDPLGPSVEALEKDVQEVIGGFSVRLAMLRSEGNDLFARAEHETPSNSVPTSGEPTMSILPIDDARDPMLDASNVILSKSEEQIKQALDAAGFTDGGNVKARAEDHVEL